MYDLLVEFENYIVGEQIIRCEHCLLGLENAEISDIRTVYSHQQGLSQCKSFLQEHRDWKQIPLENTAMAAKKVAEDGDVTQASVSSAFAAKCFGLKVVKLGENGVTEKDILVHDAHCMDNTLQLKLALMEGPDFPVALGVIRDVEAPTYDDAVNAQIEEVAAKKKYHNFQELLMTNDIWEVK